MILNVLAINLTKLLTSYKFLKPTNKRKTMSEKKDWKVTLSYNIRHDDTYLISNETKEDAVWIAENQNASPKYDCISIKKDESDIEDEETSIKEVVFNAEKKKWLDKNGK